MKYNIKLKLLREIDRRKLQKFEIQTKYNLMKIMLGGNESFISDNKIKSYNK
jgi:hypothetical protein